MRWMMFAVILGSLLPAASGAARADDASRLKLAREIVVVTHTADNMRKIMPTVMGQVRTMLIQQHAGDKKMIDAVLNRSTQHIDEQIDGFVDLAARSTRASSRRRICKLCWPSIIRLPASI